jgi:Trypsin-like peptidase domain
MTTVDDKISSYIVPLVELSVHDQEGNAVATLVGSAFYIGHNGHLLTAAHVLKPSRQRVAALVVRDGRWVAIDISASEAHPDHDVAVLSTQDPVSSFFVPLAQPHFGSAPYFQFSYPEDVAYELVVAGRRAFRPDLIYNEGHVRRRMTAIPIPGLRGQHLYELSEVAGPGSSGSPIVLQPLLHLGGGPYWHVIGVYIGERFAQTEGRISFAGYASRIDALVEWRPELLRGRTIFEL